MEINSELTPTNHWSSRPRLLVRRLRRLRSKTKSLTEDVDGNYNILSPQSPQPLSLQEFDFTRPNEQSPAIMEEDNEIEFFKCCSAYSAFEDDRVEAIVSELVNSSFELKISPKHRKKFSDVTICVSEPTDINSNDKIINTDSDNVSLNSSIITDIATSELLEEIEDALPEQYSLKRILYCPYSVPFNRTLARLLKPRFWERNKETTVHSERRSKCVNKDLERLKVELIVQETLLEQSRKALNLSFSHKDHQNEYLEAEKALLVASIKYETVKCELARLRQMQDGDLCDDPRSGVANIKEISISVEKPQTWSSYYFTCIAIEGDCVKSTCLEYVCHDGSIRFSTELHFYNLRPTFTISIYIYGINMKEVKSKFTTKSSDRLSLYKPSASSAILTHNFTLLGCCELNLSHIKHSDLILITKLQKLSHVIKMQVKGDAFFTECLNEGFLDVMRMSCDENDERVRQTWDRKWYMLTGVGLQGWNYPSQQNSMPPTDTILLSHCLSAAAKPVDISLCVRPNTFTFVGLDDDRKCKIFCSTDTSEEMWTWCRQINHAFKIFRTWKN